MVGIESAAYCIPLYSIKAEEYVKVWGYFAARGVQEKTVPGFDEDEVTMAVEAASRALGMRGSKTEDIGYVAAATSSGSRIASTLAEALGLANVRVADFVGSSNSGASAFLSSVDFVDRNKKAALVVISDCPIGAPDDPSEHPLGAASASFLVNEGGGVLLLDAHATTREEYGTQMRDEDGYRRNVGIVDYSAESIRETVQGLLSRGFKSSDFHQVLCQEFSSRTLVAAMGNIFSKEQLGGGLVRLTGDTGATSAFLSLVNALGKAQKGQKILVATYGVGASTAMAFEVMSSPKCHQGLMSELQKERNYLSYPRYLQFRKYLVSASPKEETAMGAYVSLPAYLNTIRQRYRLVGQRCAKCGRPIFPPREACPDCGSREFEELKLSGKGKVYAQTVIGRGGAPTEFKAQQGMVGEYAVAVVQLDEGPRIIAQMTDCDPRAVQIGMPVRLTLRRIYTQEGITRYGFKFKPA